MYVTRGLLTVLLEYAADADPEGFSAALASTPARDLEGASGVDPAAPVFTHLYLPSAGRSVSAVFGVDLATAPGRTQGRFVSHPDGRLALTRSDDLREVVIVAVPPWDDDSVAAFDRTGAGLSMSVIDAEPADEPAP